MSGLITQPVKTARVSETSDPVLTEQNQFFWKNTREIQLPLRVSFIYRKTQIKGSIWKDEMFFVNKASCFPFLKLNY